MSSGLVHYMQVSYRRNVVCDHSKNEGNFRDFIDQILKHFKFGRFILTYRENEIIYIKEKEDIDVMFLLITNDKVPKTNAFVTLEHIRMLFKQYFTFEEYSSAKKFSLNSEFEGILDRASVVCG